MNNIKIIILLFIHSTTSFILPSKINSLSLIKYRNFNINHFNKISMFNNKNNNNNNNNKTKIYKIIFDNNDFNDDNYEDNQTIINKIISINYLLFLN